MEIRQLAATDGIAYRDVRLRALREAPQAFGSTFEEESLHPDAFWQDSLAHIATSMEAATFAVDRGDGTLGGTAFVQVSPEPPHDAYLGAMWLDEDLRGAGWADALVGTAEEFARRLGSAAISLWVSEGNAPARRFYERQGFRSTGVAEIQPSGVVAELWLKPLAAFGP